jgi:serine/threonine protein kinase
MAEPRRCPRCQGEILADSPEGLCPECLFQQALVDPKEAADREEATRSPAPTFVPPTTAELAPHFPQLQILQLVGQGGMGAVYKARQPKLDRLVAVKILPPEVARDPGFRERFSREARSLARLNHANVVTIFDFGETEGLYYFTMEYVDGKNVRELLEAGELTSSVALKIIPQVCDALQYAHDEGFVHRDIKPENILLDKKGRVKIADFGLARLVGLTPTYLTLTGSQEVMGTLYYMAPEQMKRSHAVDHRADLYSLGVVFYEMLTGELPMGRFAPPSHKARVDARLDPVVLRALAREPELRYQDAAELKREVESVATSSPVPPAADPVERPARARAIGDWPSVRFTIPDIFRTGGEARGEVYRDEETLIVEFEEFWGWWRSGLKEVRIPFHEITSISCQSEQTPDVPGIPEWGRKWMRLKEWMAKQNTQLVIKVGRPGALTGLPVGKPGRGRLLIPWGDRAAAKQLVDSIVQQPLRGAGRNEPGVEKEGVHRPISHPDRTRMEVTMPAVGLLFTGILALVSWVLFSAMMTVAMHEDYQQRNDPVWTGEHNPWARGEGHPGARATLPRAAWVLVPLGAIVGLWAAGFLVAGALQMMRLRSYAFVVAATILAMIPWSPAWILGFPFGIWGLVVLRRPAVREAFLNNRRLPGSAVPEKREPRSPAAGKMASFFRSVAGYMLPTSLGKNPRSQSGVAVPEAEEHKAP